MVKNEAKLVASHILLRCGSVPVERILLWSPVYRFSDSEDCYILTVLFFLFPPQICRRPWADFRETLLHDAMCPEIFDLLHGCSYVPPKKIEGRKTPIFADLRTQNRHFEPRHSLIRGKLGT